MLSYLDIWTLDLNATFVLTYQHIPCLDIPTILTIISLIEGETSQAITPFHFFDYFPFFDYFHFFDYTYFFDYFHIFDYFTSLTDFPSLTIVTSVCKWLSSLLERSVMLNMSDTYQTGFARNSPDSYKAQTKRGLPDMDTGFLFDAHIWQWIRFFPCSDAGPAT